MALNAQLAQQHAIIWMLFASSFFSVCKTHESDIYCLKSIMDSMEGPALKYLWDLSRISNSSTNAHHEDSICAFTGVECSWKNNASESKIVHIRLSDMGLTGQFPRAIINCTSLLGLDLSRNKLSGLLPLDISRMIPFVSWLNLSSNNFSGEIPPDIANLSRLKVLRLDHNQLSGQIPPPVLGLLLSRRLVYFSVANNINLSSAGTVPNFVIHANNSQLCGAPEECSSNPINKDDHEDDDDPFISGFIIGWSISVVLVFAATTSFCMPNISLGKLTTRSKKTEKKKKFRKKTKAIRLRRSQKLIIRRRIDLYSKIHTFDKCVTRMNYKYLLRVTDNFSQRNVIGLGKHGTFYRGTLGHGNFLAVKRFGDDFQQHQQQHFMSEVLTIGRFRQRNLVPLLGFCIERKERLLVYKYMANGSLYDWLHPNDSNNSNNHMRAILEWPLRFRISIGIARGLAWLHHKFKYRITHGNICSKSILLDKNLDPKISNFGRAMIIKSNHSNSNLRIFVNGESRELDGTVASKYECLVEAPKNDVYSFGILLLEVVTGEPPDDLSNMCSQDFCGNFVQWVSYHHLDESLIGSRLGLFDGEICQCLQVAFDCIRPCSNERPTMLKVYKSLRAIGVEKGYNFVPSTQIISNSDVEIAEEIE